MLVIAIVVWYAAKQDTSSSSDIESIAEDQPPSYETVTTKPPPYHHLFVEAPPTADVIPGTLLASYRMPVDNVVQTSNETSRNPAVENEVPPPLYSEAMTDNRPCNIQPRETAVTIDTPPTRPLRLSALELQSSPSPS